MLPIKLTILNYHKFNFPRRLVNDIVAMANQGPAVPPSLGSSYRIVIDAAHFASIYRSTTGIPHISKKDLKEAWDNSKGFYLTDQNDLPTLEAWDDPKDLSKLLQHCPLTPLEQELAFPENRITILPHSPTLAWLEKMLQGEIKYNVKDWRQFEEAVAELLEKDGYHVTLGPGRKDGGQDLFATKEDPILGLIATVWQAKMLVPGNRVKLGVIRELAGTCKLSGTKTTKGIIVTSTYLTRDALLQVEQDRHFLGKRDHDDLLHWIDQVKKRR